MSRRAMMVAPAVPGGGGASSHAYWRIVAIQPVSGGSPALSAVGFRDGSGSSITVSGGSTLESGHLTGGAGNLFDGNDTTFWDADSSNFYANYAGYHFGSAQQVRQVGLQVHASMNGGVAPAECIVQWSDDGTAWATAAWLVVGSLTNDTMKWFDFTNVYPTATRTDFGSHAYWQEHSSDPNGNSFTALSAMLFKDGGGSSIATTGGSAFESGHFSSFTSANLFDSNDATFWESNSGQDQVYAGYQFSSGKTVMQLGLQRHASMDGSDPPIQCRCEFSDNGNAWGLAAAIIVGTLTNDTPTYFNLSTGL